MSRAVEPTATPHHEGALGRNQHQTSTKVCRRLEGNQEPAPREGCGSREAGESQNYGHTVSLPDQSVPEVAFAGRSNVGKSSLINRLLHRKKAARVSNTPGRTREVNFFEVNKEFVIADLPGYGYARISKEAKQAWQPLIEGYLRNSPQLRGVVQLLDVRHAPSPDDHEMLGFLADIGAPTLIAATKVDKLTRSEAPKKLRDLALAIGVEDEQIIPFSSVTGMGRDDLAAAVVARVAEPPWRYRVSNPATY